MLTTLLQIKYPDSTTNTVVAFDADDRLLARVDGNGNSISYGYTDPTGLLTGVDYPSGWANLDVHLTYDQDNRRTGMTDSSGSSSTTYDTLGDPLTVTTSYTGLLAQTLSYGYNADGSRATLSAPTLPGTHTFSYSYDGAGRLTGVVNPNGLSASWAYSAADLLTQVTLGNGAVTTYTHNP
jgi:YD repeat-containing protein